MPNEYIPQVLKEYRQRNHLTINEVALLLSDRSINVAPKTIYGWESGQANPNADTLLTLCEMYNITDVLAVFGYTKDEVPFHITATERSLVESYRKHPELQVAVNKLLDIKVRRRTPRSDS